MTRTAAGRCWPAIGLGLALAVSLTACGGNLGSGGSAGSGTAEFPGGEPVTILVGADPGGSTDLIARALAEPASDDLGVPVVVENRPGANGAIAARELATAAPDGHRLMIFNGSLAYITPLAVSPEEAVDMADYEIITGVSQDDYVLVTAPSSGLRTVQDLVNAGRPITYGTTGVGTGSELSQALLFHQAGVPRARFPSTAARPRSPRCSAARSTSGRSSSARRWNRSGRARSRPS